MDALDSVEEREELSVRLGRALFGGVPVIIGPTVLAGSLGLVTRARHSGATGVLVLTSVQGAGPIPDEDAAKVVWLEHLSYPTLTEELRDHDRLVRELPDEAIGRINQFDPTRAAHWLCGPFVTSETPVLGRPVFGGRPATWLALEDKIAAEDVWAAAGVLHEPAAVVPLEREALRNASAHLDRGAGVVWAGDNRGGFHGAGDLVRWVTDAVDEGAEFAAAMALFEPRCDRARVQPFLEGVPCSIHGMVLPDGTAAFRPVEITVLRDGHRFQYAGTASYWDPPEADRAEMRAIVCRVGEHLRERVGYRGSFGIDGVLSADGFRPTELNTRYSAGLTNLAYGLADPADPLRGGDALQLVQLACLRGIDPQVGVAAMESVVPVMDARRTGRITASWDGDFDTSPLDEHGAAAYDVSLRDGRLVGTGADGAGPSARLILGATATGLYARVEDNPWLASGQRAADLNIALMAHLDETLGCAFGELRAAPDVRRA